MNAHARIDMDLEPAICHLAREARAAQMMAEELISQLHAYSTAEAAGDVMVTLTAEAQEMLTDFTARVAICANDLRVAFYRSAR